MVDDQHDDADDVTDADDDFEAAVGHLTPGLLARVGSGVSTAEQKPTTWRRKSLPPSVMFPGSAGSRFPRPGLIIHRAPRGAAVKDGHGHAFLRATARIRAINRRLEALDAEAVAEIGRLLTERARLKQRLQEGPRKGRRPAAQAG